MEEGPGAAADGSGSGEGKQPPCGRPGSDGLVEQTLHALVRLPGDWVCLDDADAAAPVDLEDGGFSDPRSERADGMALDEDAVHSQ